MAIDAALGRLGIQTGVCTSSTRPANPYEGQVIYETDTNRSLVYDNAAWVVIANASPTGFPTSLDTNTVDSIAALQAKVGVNSSAVTSSHDYKIAQLEGQGAWTAYTPTISNFTANSLDCAYAQVGDIVFLQIRADVATVSNLPVFSTPSGLDFANTAQFAQQSAHFIDIGTTSYQALVRWNGATSFYFTSVTTSSGYAFTGGVGASAPFTWASGDIIEGNLWYRTA